MRSLKNVHISFAISAHPPTHKIVGTVEQIFMMFGIGEFY